MPPSIPIFSILLVAEQFTEFVGDSLYDRPCADISFILGDNFLFLQAARSRARREQDSDGLEKKVDASEGAARCSYLKLRWKPHSWCIY